MDFVAWLTFLHKASPFRVNHKIALTPIIRTEDMRITNVLYSVAFRIMILNARKRRVVSAS